MIAISIILILACYSIIPTYLFKLLWLKNYKCFKNKKAVMLTFDDGPDEKYTNKILDLLKKHQVKAGFFVVANFAEKNPQIIKRMILEGHFIGIHSKNHENALYRGVLFTRNDLKSSLSILKSLGCDVDFYRPPWGHLNLFSLYYIRKYNLKLMLWNVMVGDWKNSKDVILEKLKKKVKNGSLICLHDGRGTNNAPKNTLSALEEFIPYLKAQGYQFITAERI